MTGKISPPPRHLRIGTRASELAQWQANQVLIALQSQLSSLGLEANLHLVPIASEGDQDSSSALHSFASPGVFTKALDQALLENKIDIAVHSLKDLPTILLPGISLACVLPRDTYSDVLVYNHKPKLKPKSKEAQDFHVATGSIRRQSQWRHRYPSHQISNLRGNVQTRLQQLYSGVWDGIILSKAGIDRLGIQGLNMEVLDWMTPAPAQGVIAVTTRSSEPALWIAELLQSLHHAPTAYAVQQERDFLQALGSGCSLPLGAVAELEHGTWQFRATVVVDAMLINVRKAGEENLGLAAAKDLLQAFPDLVSKLQT